MDETRRYNEPKIIGDIIKDMKLDPSTIERQTKIHQSCRKFAEDIMKTWAQYMFIMDNLHPLYREASKIIQEIDAFYATTRSGFQKAKLAVKEGTMTQKDINEVIRFIEKKLTAFEIDQGDIRQSLRKSINKFPSQKDRIEHTIKTNNFCNLFMQIYCEIDDFCMDYDRLRRKAPLK